MAKKKDENLEGSQEESKAAETKVESPVVPSGPRKIKVDAKQLESLQKEGRLIGWNPATGEALVK